MIETTVFNSGIPRTNGIKILRSGAVAAGGNLFWNNYQFGSTYTQFIDGGGSDAQYGDRYEYRLGIATTKMGFYGATPVVRSTGWSTSNVVSDKILNANSVTVDELADVVGSLIDYFKSLGFLGA
jgi:hypothetical protein